MMRRNTTLCLFHDDEAYQRLELQQQQPQFFAQTAMTAATTASSQQDDIIEGDGGTGGRVKSVKSQTSTPPQKTHCSWEEKPTSYQPQQQQQQTPNHINRSKRNREDEEQEEEEGDGAKAGNCPSATSTESFFCPRSETKQKKPSSHSSSKGDPPPQLPETHHRYLEISPLKNQGAQGYLVTAKDLHLLQDERAGNSSSTVVIKRTSKQHPRRNANEVELMKKFIGSPGMIQFKDSYETSEDHNIVMELCSGGDFFDLTSQLKGKEILCRKFFIQLVKGLQVMQDQGVLHQDLKPENLLLRGWGVNDVNAQLVIADLGIAQKIDPEEKKLLKRTSVGTYAYMSPERLRSEPCDFSSEVWACGAILFLWVENRKPFSGRTPEDFHRLHQLRSVASKKKKGRVPSLRFGSKTSPQLQDLILKLLCHDPTKRPTLQEVLDHPWCTSSE